MKLIIIQSYLPRILFLTILVNSNSTVNASLRWPTWNKKKQPGTTKEQLKPESPHSASPPPTATSSAPESEHPTKLANDKVDSHSNLNPSDVRPASLDLSQKPTGSSSTNATSSISVSEHPELAEPESPRSSTPRPAAANSASESEHPTKLANDKVDNHPNLKPSKVRPASLDLSHKNAASQPPEKRSSGELSLPQPNKLIAQTLALDPVRLPSKQRPSSVDIGLLSRQKPAEHLSSSPTPSTTKLKPLALEPEI